MPMYSEREAELIKADARAAFEKKRRANPFTMGEPRSIWQSEYQRLADEVKAEKAKLRAQRKQTSRK